MTKNKLKPGDKVQLLPDLLYSKIGDEIVLLTVESGKYFKVDSIGSQIWEMIKEPIMINELNDRLLKEFNVQAEQCQEDVLSFLDNLNENDLIVVH